MFNWSLLEATIDSTEENNHVTRVRSIFGGNPELVRI